MISKSQRFFLLVIFLPGVSLIYLAKASSSFGFSNETDRQALLAIKSELGPNRALSSWNDSLHFCHWYGVRCGRRQQRVLSLNLSSLNLVGNLSPHIGNLSFLNQIDLGNNAFRGSIPPELGRLRRLQSLSFWNNSLRGEIPLNLTRCSNLKFLALIGNQLEGRIPAELGSLSQLQALGLAVNSLVGVIPPSIGNLTSLVRLSLSSNQLEGNIPPELGQLSNLQFLQLSTNHLSGQVPPELYNISSLAMFAVADNELNGRLPSNLGLTLPNLQAILLGMNQFSGSVPASLANCSSLVRIQMEANAFTGKIPENLGSLQNLQFLVFDGNKLGAPNSESLSFITSLSNCTNLLVLTFQDNKLGGTLREALGNLSSTLWYLGLGFNYITGNIPSGIGNLVGLEKLYSAWNLLTGHIPSTIGRLSNLQEVYLYKNRLTGEIPSSIGNITGLTVFEPGYNQLEGTIPESLGNCKLLTTVDLRYNHLNGTIPRQLFGLTSLSSGLSLASNNFTGPLPEEVSNLKKVNFLDFSDNKLGGRIPFALESCQTLEILNLSKNHFEGDIPSLEKLRGVRILDLSQNNLSGQIPVFLGELNLTSLNLSFNNFEGEVPKSGVFGNISGFSISGNRLLCGGIEALRLPACPTKISDRNKHFSSKLIIALSASLSVVLISAGVLALTCRKRMSKKPLSFFSFSEKTLQRFSYADLFGATNGFSSSNLVGQGRYGSVYKGILASDNKEIAVKVFNLHERGASKIFMAECEALRTIRHRNLVRIITSCSSIDFQGNDFKALVFEFMPNGSLGRWLHPSLSEAKETRGLNLIQRLNIAIDVASAIHYLHTQCDTTMIHCDLKPNNILLDDEFTACVSDFGLTKFLSSARDGAIREGTSSVGVRGTVGYIAPEYGMGEEVSTSGDLYSFGVILMELFTGKSPTDGCFTTNFSLHDFVKAALLDRVVEIVDPLVLQEDWNEDVQMERMMECLVSVFQIGVVCSAHSPKERMNIEQALAELQKIKKLLI